MRETESQTDTQGVVTDRHASKTERLKVEETGVSI